MNSPVFSRKVARIAPVSSTRPLTATRSFMGDGVKGSLFKFCKNIQDDTLTQNHDLFGCGIAVNNAFHGSGDIVDGMSRDLPRQ